MSEELRTLSAEYAGWKERVNKGSFLVRRGDVVQTGTEAIIYKRPKLDIVIKEFRDGQDPQGYETAAILLPDIVAPFEFIKDFPIKVDFSRHVIPSGMAQAKVLPLDIEFIKYLQERNVPKLAEIVGKFAAVDRTIFKRGVFIPDPGYANYGFDKLGNVVLADAGGIITAFSDIGKYMVYANGRGKVHYSHYLALKAAGQSIRLQFGEQPLEVLYTNSTDLNFNPNLSTLEQLVALLTPDPHIFHQFFWEVGQQEFEQFSPTLSFTRQQQKGLLDILANQRGN